MKPVFQVKLNDTEFANVFFWKNKRAFSAATRRFRKKNKKMVACYIAKKTNNGWIREIHYIEPYIGAGYVAHELFHLCYHLMKPNDENEEDFANLLEEITRRFWDNYYMLPQSLSLSGSG